jgi:preprotein translocase subunit SecE
MAVKQAVQFLKEVKSELARVVWPRFDEFVGALIVVLLVMAFFAIYLGLLDLGFTRLAQFIFAWYNPR